MKLFKLTLIASFYLLLSGRLGFPSDSKAGGTEWLTEVQEGVRQIEKGVGKLGKTIAKDTSKLADDSGKVARTGMGRVADELEALAKKLRTMSHSESDTKSKN